MISKQSYCKLRLILLFYVVYNSILYAASHSSHIDIAIDQKSLAKVHLELLIRWVDHDNSKDIFE